MIPAFRFLLRCSLAFCVPGTASASTGFIRVNQIGYIAGETKQAVLLSSSPVTGTFAIVDSATATTVYSAPIPVTSQGSWNTTYPNTYALDFSDWTTAGTYSIRVSGTVTASSPTFRIGSAASVYSGSLSNLLLYFQAQRDGPDVVSAVLSRHPSHVADQSASVYAQPTYNANDFLKSPLKPIAGPIDVSGGWFDAGDFVKFVQTTSYVEGMMLFAIRQYPNLLAAHGDFVNESRFGLDWLFKMWDQSSRTLYYQVGLTDGDSAGTIGSDHDIWRLPEVDDLLNVSMPSQYYYYVRYRPVFRLGTGGTVISPNLAGRLAAALALGAQVFHESDPAYANRCLMAAQTIFDLAKTSSVGTLLTTSPHDNYPEVEWRDDLEWAGAELYFATALGNQPPGLPHNDAAFYLQQSASWAQKYLASPNHLQDSLNLYDVSALAHYELYKAMSQAGSVAGLAVTQAGLLNDLKAQLAQGTTQAARDPFGLGLAYDSGVDIVPHALGYAITATLYKNLTGAADYDLFAQRQRDWALGKNAWGSSFIIGAGSTFPFWPQHQVANLAGAHDGTSPILLGGVVDGPSPVSTLNGLGSLDGMINTPPGPDPFSAFTTNSGIAYVDNVIDWPTVEPANDYTIASLVVFASQVGEIPSTVSVQASAANASELPGANGAFTITRTGSTLGALSVQTLIGGTATVGADFTIAASPVTIAPNFNSAQIVVTPIVNSAANEDRTVTLTLAQNSGYSVGIPGTATVTIHFRPFDAWLLSKFNAAQLTDPNISGPIAHPNAAGISNLMAYALDLDPFFPSMNGLPKGNVADGYLTLTYTRLKDATDILYQAVWSNDLATWSDTGVTVEVVLGSDNGVTQQVQARVPLSGETKKFMRLQITQL